MQEKVRIAKLLFVAAAGISFAFSVWLWFGGQREEGLFVTLLTLVAAVLVGLSEASDPEQARSQDLTDWERSMVNRDGGGSTERASGGSG